MSGPNEIGTYRLIEIIRDGKIFSKVDLYNYFVSGVSPNIFLRDQDIILVPAYKKGFHQRVNLKEIIFLKYLKMKLFQTLLNIQVNSIPWLIKIYREDRWYQ